MYKDVYGRYYKYMVLYISTYKTANGWELLVIMFWRPHYGWLLHFKCCVEVVFELTTQRVGVVVCTRLYMGSVCVHNDVCQWYLYLQDYVLVLLASVRLCRGDVNLCVQSCVCLSYVCTMNAGVTVSCWYGVTGKV